MRPGSDIFKNTYGYLASEQERADDLNNLVSDEAVKIILFGGGWGASEILPLIDYENIKRHPKLFCSYNDSISSLIFGHYSNNVPDDLLRRLERCGEKHNVPVVYCDDFGHGIKHLILPLGIEVSPDTDGQVLAFKK